MITTWLALTASAMSSRAVETGSWEGYSISCLHNLDDAEAFRTRVLCLPHIRRRAACRATGSANRNPDSSAPPDMLRLPRSAAEAISRAACAGLPPTRIGGFDQIRSNVVSAGMPSAVAAWMLPMPLSSALRRVSSSARSVTSNAQMSAFGEEAQRQREWPPTAAQVEERPPREVPAPDAAAPTCRPTRLPENTPLTPPRPPRCRAT